MTWWRKLIGWPEKKDGYIEIPIPKDIAIKHGWMGGKAIMKITDKQITLTKIPKGKTMTTKQEVLDKFKQMFGTQQQVLNFMNAFVHDDTHEEQKEPELENILTRDMNGRFERHAKPENITEKDGWLEFDTTCDLTDICQNSTINKRHKKMMHATIVEYTHIISKKKKLND